MGFTLKKPLNLLVFLFIIFFLITAISLNFKLSQRLIGKRGEIFDVSVYPSEEPSSSSLAYASCSYPGQSCYETHETTCSYTFPFTCSQNPECDSAVCEVIPSSSPSEEPSSAIGGLTYLNEGEVGCNNYPNTCSYGLTCEDNVCVANASLIYSPEPSPSEEPSPAIGGLTYLNEGEVGCNNYPNTCSYGLTCEDNVCVANASLIYSPEPSEEIIPSPAPAFDCEPFGFCLEGDYCPSFSKKTNKRCSRGICCEDTGWNDDYCETNEECMSGYCARDLSGDNTKFCQPRPTPIPIFVSQTELEFFKDAKFISETQSDELLKKSCNHNQTITIFQGEVIYQNGEKKHCDFYCLYNDRIAKLNCYVPAKSSIAEKFCFDDKVVMSGISSETEILEICGYGEVCDEIRGAKMCELGSLCKEGKCLAASDQLCNNPGQTTPNISKKNSYLYCDPAVKRWRPIAESQFIKWMDCPDSYREAHLRTISKISDWLFPQGGITIKCYEKNDQFLGSAGGANTLTPIVLACGDLNNPGINCDRILFHEFAHTVQARNFGGYYTNEDFNRTIGCQERPNAPGSYQFKIEKPVSVRGQENCDEAYAEAVAKYIITGCEIKETSPLQYNWVRNNIFTKCDKNGTNCLSKEFCNL